VTAARGRNGAVDKRLTVGEPSAILENPPWEPSGGSGPAAAGPFAADPCEPMPRRNRKPRWAWVLTGSGHFFDECLAIMAELDDFDVFVSLAAEEVLRMYRHRGRVFPDRAQVFRDTTASAAPVGEFYKGQYHTLVMAPVSSNTVAKCVAGISDNLATNVYAQAGKCRVPSIVFACDTAPELDTMAPKGMVKVYPRRIDLENVERLKAFEATTVVESMAGLEQAIAERKAWLNASSS
jgi:flavoprotein